MSEITDIVSKIQASLQQTDSSTNKETKKTNLFDTPAVTTDIGESSGSGDVFGAVDNFFNLSSSNRLDSYSKLSDEDKKTFLKVVAELAKDGYVGYEVFEINGQKEKHSIESEIGDKRLYGAKRKTNYNDIV